MGGGEVTVAGHDAIKIALARANAASDSGSTLQHGVRKKRKKKRVTPILPTSSVRGGGTNGATVSAHAT